VAGQDTEIVQSPGSPEVDAQARAGRAGLDLLEDLAAVWLEALARLAADRDQLEQAARLTEAVQLLRPTSAGNRALAQQFIRPRWFGTTPLGLAAPQNNGAPNGCVVDQSGPAAGKARGARPGSAPLTRREQEVAVLIARGLTNRDIARQLVISERTVDTHVGNILSKLRLTSRAQVAAWAVEHRLGASQEDKRWTR
jgi:DNA-binding NarL/FixJ family response regulator